MRLTLLGSLALTALIHPASATAQGPIGHADAHVHLSLGSPADLDSLLARGVTVVRDAGGDLQQLLRWRTEIAAGSRRGPRLLIAGPIIDGPKPGAAHRFTVETPAEAERAVDSLARAGVDNPAGKAFQAAMFKQGIPVAAFEVSDLAAEFARLSGKGLVFTQPPTSAGPVMLAVFADTCGNLIQLYQPTG
jgi:hypothetical protein